MRRRLTKTPCIVAIAAALWLMTTAASAQQWYMRYYGTMSAVATGQFTTPLMDETRASNGVLTPALATTNSPGALMSFRAYPIARSGLEVNYGYAKLRELNFNAATGAPMSSLQTNMHEFTGAYLFRLHVKRFIPYVGVGGGYTDFTEKSGAHNADHQWRETGLAEVSWDKEARPWLGLRVGARDLICAAPNFSGDAVKSSRWFSTTEPYVGVYITLKHE